MKRLAAALAASAALAAGAQSHWYVQFDNDLGFETDRWYSSGFRLGRVTRHGDHEREWGVLHEIYTPDVKNFSFLDDDRMPTARLLATFARHDRSEAAWQTLEVDAGVRGPAANGRAITRAAHNVVRARRVDWSRQGDDRFDLQLVASRTQRALDWLNVNYGAVLGTEVAFAHVGAELRIGTRGVNAPSTSAVRFAASPPQFGYNMEGCWSAFVAASGRRVFRNEMLERNYNPFGAAIERRRTVARLAAGFSWAWPRGIVTFAVVHDAKEFRQQARGHTFASLLGHYDF